MKLPEGTRKLVGLFLCLIVIVLQDLLGHELTEFEAWVMSVIYGAFVLGNGAEYLLSAMRAKAAQGGLVLPAPQPPADGGTDDSG